MKLKLINFIQQQFLLFFNFYFLFFEDKTHKVVIGVDEVANQTQLLKNIFKNNAISVNFTVNKFYKSNVYDYSIQTQNRLFRRIIKLFYGPYLLAKLSNQADVFIYFWYTGFCNNRELDYKYLKKKNKKIVCIFLGSDIRSYSLTKQFHDKNAFDCASNYIQIDLADNDKRVKQTAFLADKYADLIFNYEKDQMSYLTSKLFTMPYMIYDKFLTCHLNKFDNLHKVVIVHAPSNPILKGTPIVRAAIKKLEIEGYNFEYIELINKSNSEVLKTLEKSHIVINEFYAYIPGLFTIEGMAKCNAVITSSEYDGFPQGAEEAWFKTNYWEVYDNVKYLLDNKNEIKRYAKNGFEFVKNNYTEEKVREFYINTFYEHNIIDDKNIFQK